MDTALTPVLALKDVRRSFGPVEVLHGLDIELKPGRVHALIGENGAGKSTTMKIMAGYQPPTSGAVLLDGREVAFANMGEAEAAGIVMIHQEFNLAEHLSVEESLFLGREKRRGIFLDKARMRAETRDNLARLNCHVDPDRKVSTLSNSDKQMLEIAKALSRDARLLIMDEPTAVLTSTETGVLMDQVRKLREAGTTILFTSHKLDEVEAIADDLTVMRDGNVVYSGPAAAMDQHAMALSMVGREISDLFPAKLAPAASASLALSVRDLAAPGFSAGISFDLREGEILGIGGLIGSVRSETFEGLCGLRPATGQVEIFGKPVSIKVPADALAHGLCYLTEDRKTRGLLLKKTMRENLTLQALRRFSGILVDRRAEEEALTKAIGEFDIRAGRRDVEVGFLSGGNQQKLLLAKTMLSDPRIVVIDEPTRGIDIGTKQQIYRFVRDLAAKDRAIVVISSEMQELIALADRILVMRQGRLAGEVAGDSMTEENIVRNMMIVGPIVALVALVLIGALLNPSFLAWANISNVLTRSAFIGIIAVGMTFVITSGGLDLSVGAMAAFIAGLMILVMNTALPTLGIGLPIVLLGMATALAAGLFAGLLNGFLITKLGIETFIVTLGSMGIYRSLVTWLADGGTLSLDFGLRTFYQPVYYGGVLGVSWPIIVFAIVVILGEIDALDHVRPSLRRHRLERPGRALFVDQRRPRAPDHLRRARAARRHRHHHVRAAPRLRLRIDRPPVGTGSDRGGDHRRHRPEGRLRPGLGHRHRRPDPQPHREHPEPDRSRLPYLNGAIQGAIIILAVILQRESKPGA